MPFINHQYLNDIEAELAQAGSVESFVWSTAADTDVGRVRSRNEDAFFCTEEQGLWIVADGMGGHSRGDKASQVVVDDVRSFVRFDSFTESIKDIETRFLLSNNTCRAMFPQEKVGSTAAALFAFGSLSVFLWVGDSRIYRLRDGILTLMTEDHSLVQERYRRGELTLEEAQQDPSANVLTQAIGVHQNLRVDMQCASVERHDRYLLCSDGLYRDLLGDEIQAHLGEGDIQEALDNLMKLALERGGKDNITAMIVQVD